MNRTTKHEYNPQFMLRAIELSQLAYKSGKGLPIGCVISRNGEIIGEGHNEIFERTNPTSHAEMVAIERACKNIKDLQLSDCEMYTTLEPCPMCLAAIYWSKLGRVFYANTKQQATEMGFDDSLIFNELMKAAEDRQISVLNVSEPKALDILKEWKSENRSAAQPWNK